MTDREESLLKALEKDPVAVLYLASAGLRAQTEELYSDVAGREVADIVRARPELREIANALTTWAFLTRLDHFELSRPPKGGKAGRRRDSIAGASRKKTAEAFIRANVAVLRRAIMGEPIPPELLEMWKDGFGVPMYDVPGAVAWARAELAKERKDRENCGPGVEVHTPKEWAARAYLRATKSRDAWLFAGALLKRVEAASAHIEPVMLKAFPK